MVTLITGPMFSSKSTELLRYLERAIRGKKRVCLIRPSVDDRSFFSHSLGTQALYTNMEIPVYTLAKDSLSFDMNIIQKIKDNYDVIGIDECQFIEYLDSFVVDLIVHKKDVYMSGLLSTSECRIFDPIKEVLPYCDNIIKLNAVCSHCGSDIGNYTYYHGTKTNSVEVGGSDKYSALCSVCFFLMD